MPAKPVTEEKPSDRGDDLDMTCVSETDAEVETLPYTKSPLHYGSEGQRSPSVHDFAVPVQGDVKAEKGKEKEDDALRLVREIFFT